MPVRVSSPTNFSVTAEVTSNGGMGTKFEPNASFPSSADALDERVSANEKALNLVGSSVSELAQRFQSSNDEEFFLHSFLYDNDFRAIFEIYEIIANSATTKHLPTVPVTTSASSFAEWVCEELDPEPSDQYEVEELQDILSTPDFRALLASHDLIANKEFSPRLSDPVPDVEDECEQSIKIVHLVKRDEPLGATIRVDDRSGRVHIARVMLGGAADRSGLILPGDEVQEVNGVVLRGREPQEIAQLLAQLTSAVTLKLIPGSNVSSLPSIPDDKETLLFRVKPHFSYDPYADPSVPCKNAGLAFKRGEVLQIVNTDDPSWWQARKDDDIYSRAGLIPSRQLQERRLALKLSANQALDFHNMNDSTNLSPNNGVSWIRTLLSPRLKRSRRLPKFLQNSNKCEDLKMEENLVTYEEVDVCAPDAGFYRPIILVGPSGVGLLCSCHFSIQDASRFSKNELKRRLVMTDPDHFRTTVPHTTRPPLSGEADGLDYYFVSKTQFEMCIAQQKFVEYGEYRGNFYGTSLDTIQDIINSGRVCVMTPHPQALKLLRTKDVKPFVIFVKPPSFEKLKLTRFLGEAKSVSDETRPFTDDEFQDMIFSSARMECLYGHMFDRTIVNADLNNAFNELLEVARVIEFEPQWVPSNWVR